MNSVMKAAPAGTGPLAGMRVIELTSTVAGPFCGRLLADFGAEVIKIEPAEGDAVRSMGARSDGASLYAASILRNKKLIALDMRRSEAQALVRDLLRQADVFIENFRPGTMEKWGLGYEALSSDNPGLVMVRISGYGQTGPYSQRPGYGVTSEAISGLRDLTGDPDRPPARVATSLTDYITGLYAAFGAAMALIERNRSGKGQVIDAALYEAAFSFVEPHIPAFAALGSIATRAGSRLPGHVPNNLYSTADDRYVQIVAASDSIFRRLLRAMQRDDLAQDVRFSTPAARAQHPDEMDAVIGAWTGSLPLADLECLLAENEVPAARIYNIADIFSDPHYQSRAMLQRVSSEEFGEVTVTGVVPRLSRTPGEVGWAGRAVGSDTHEVLADLLGMRPDAIVAMQQAGIASGRR
ncbi:MAG: CoA transferase [Ferrovibrio sp.]|uniref:CaiB/BaiF CoA transferase family protein n=1 Tax=Ferrovibrio sp. TaxID=1917215 RepID=UPI00262744F8|nr:CoA transferase [Ferrovibrio sp.]MCW0234567.1 CoA transferase [Ferrovibrio sp.]